MAVLLPRRLENWAFQTLGLEVRIDVSFTALQFREALAYDKREISIEVPEGSTILHVIRLLSQKVGMDIEALLRSKKVVLMFRNRMVDLERDGNTQVTEGGRLVFINPLIGG